MYYNESTTSIHHIYLYMQVFPSGFKHSYDDKKNLVVGVSRDLFTRENLKKFERSWEEKIPTAFFRGTATGGGVTSK